jgi:hypothetical protein
LEQNCQPKYSITAKEVALRTCGMALGWRPRPKAELPGFKAPAMEDRPWTGQPCPMLSVPGWHRTQRRAATQGANELASDSGRVAGFLCLSAEHTLSRRALYWHVTRIPCQISTLATQACQAHKEAYPILLTQSCLSGQLAHVATL